MHEVTLIPGSGLGPRAAEVARDVVAAAGVNVKWDVQNEDVDAMVASVRRTGVALKGKVAATPTPGKQPFTVQFRRALGIHAIVRHVRHVPGLPARAPETDLVIVREASEDIYAGFEHESTDGVFESVKVTTKAACERIARFAFEFAAKNGRGKVTTVHKANILKKADGMFLSTSREVAAQFPGIRHDDIIVDALCMRLVRRPRDFDVLLCGNLFGDIVSDCAAGMAGGVTVATGVGYGPGVVLFENPHGPIAAEVGEDGANPLPMVLLAADMLKHLGEIDAARRLRGAVEKALAAGVRTHDMGGTTKCAEVRGILIASL
ncbi:MAG: isocitrate/isopropylmalate family dehydrogenase [Myxococcota bacterium]